MKKFLFMILALMLVISSCQREQVQPGEISIGASKIPVIKITGSLHRNKGENSHGECNCRNNCGGICGIHAWVLGFQIFRNASTGSDGEIHFYATSQRLANDEGTFIIWPQDLNQIDVLDEFMVDEAYELTGEVAEELGYSRVTFKPGQYLFDPEIGANGGYSLDMIFQEL